MSQLQLPHSSLRFRFPLLPSVLHRRRVASLPTNYPLSLKSTKSTLFRPLTIVRSRFSESGNLFLLYIFGKIVEEEKGNVGLWLSYLFTGVGANLASWLVLSPKAFSLGASGAVFGLFVISVLVKMSWGWSKFLEVLILGQFIAKRVFEETQVSAGLLDRIASWFGILTILQAKPVAHFSGALVGVVFVGLLSKFSSEPVDQEP